MKLNGFFYSIVFFSLLLSACKYDDYHSVPDSVDGYGLLSLPDTGNSLAETIVMDTLDHRDSFSSCHSDAFSPILGYQKIKLITFRGIQLVKGNKFLFIAVKGSLYYWTENNNVINIGSTLGVARIVFDSNFKATVNYFDFKRKVEFPMGYCEMERGPKYKMGGKQVVFIECPSEVNGFLYGWEKKRLIAPKCYF